MYFQTKHYTVKSIKIHEPIRFVLITDLHDKEYGSHNRDILSAVASLHPDIILCAGDMIIGRGDLPINTGTEFVCALTEIAPVYLSNGNHESELRKYTPDLYAFFFDEITKAGVHVLNNRSEHLIIGKNIIRIYGLETGLCKYKKFRIHHMSEHYLTERIGEAQKDGCFNLLIAHNPTFGDLYYRWGADLIVSGHYHGGLFRSPFSGRAMLSPYGTYYPKHGYGQYIWCDHQIYLRNTSDKVPFGDSVPCGPCMITSSGLGDHELPIRLFNPHELVCIDVKEA